MLKTMHNILEKICINNEKKSGVHPLIIIINHPVHRKDISINLRYRFIILYAMVIFICRAQRRLKYY